MSHIITRRTANSALLGFGAMMFGGPAHGQGLRKLPYGIATTQITQGYTFATLPVSLGYFKEEGLDVGFLNAEMGVTFQLMASGQAEIAATTPEAAIAARVKNGLDVKSFFAVARKSPYHIAVTENSPIKTVPDLAGKKIGVGSMAGAGTLYLLRLMKQQAGIDPKSVDLQAVGSGLAAMEGLVRGRIDALVSYDSVFAGMSNAGYKYRYLPEGPDDRRYYGYNLYARDKFIRENPDIIAKVGRATAKSIVFVKENPAAAVRLFWDLFPDRAPKTRNDVEFNKELVVMNSMLTAMLTDELPNDFKWGSQTADVWDFMQKTAVENGLIDKTLDPHEFFDNSQEAKYLDFDMQAVVRQAKAMKS